MNGDATTTGTIEDVAAFFRVSVRSVNAWKKQRLIATWQMGRNVVFGEEAVVALRVKRTINADRMQPGEAEEAARREWREHLGVRRAESDWHRRVIRLEDLMQGQVQNESTAA